MTVTPADRRRSHGRPVTRKSRAQCRPPPETGTADARNGPADPGPPATEPITYSEA